MIKVLGSLEGAVRAQGDPAQRAGRGSRAREKGGRNSRIMGGAVWQPKPRQPPPMPFLDPAATAHKLLKLAEAHDLVVVPVS